jgi:hypothetical protein
MYHEILQEMEQLLSSLHDIDRNFERAGRYVESHVFFDGCIKAEVLGEYVLQLASVIESTLKVKLCEVIKVITPYGMQLRWLLPGGLPIVIHLKDNTKVSSIFPSEILIYRVGSHIFGRSNPIDPLQHVGMQLNLEGKTKEFQSPENWNLLFCPPNSATFRRAAMGLLD